MRNGSLNALSRHATLGALDGSFNSLVPQTIYASAVLVCSLGLLVLIVRKGFGVARFKLGGASIEVLSRIEQKVDTVNLAVNHADEGQPTLAQRVVDIDQRMDVHTVWVRESLETLASRLNVDLSPYPPTRSEGLRTRSTDREA